MRSSLGRSRWSWSRATACVLALLLLGEASDTRGAARLDEAVRIREIGVLDSARARLDDKGAALAADRAEFVLSALMPIASALGEARTELAGDLP